MMQTPHPITDNIGTAIRLAASYHNGQKDKSGKPYLLHPLKVMTWVEMELGKYPELIPNGFTLEELMIAAVLHDTVEDTELTLQTIRVTFGDKVAEIVDSVTRRKDETYKMFVCRAAKHPAGKIIKKADVLHNLSRIHNLPESEQSIKFRYLKALEILYEAI